jgi:hypothetical protein
LAAIAAVAPAHRASADPTHKIRFENRCSQQLWLAVFGSSDEVPANYALAPMCNQGNAATLCPSGQCDAGSCTCASDNDCTFGSTADTTASCDTTNGRCVRTTKLEVGTSWSGRVWPRTGCSGSNTSFICETGQCGPPSGGNIDCTQQNAAANVATLFELAAAGVGGTDNFDVSLVSGYNVPVYVKVKLPPTTSRWQPSTTFNSGDEIIENVGGDNFRFTNGGSTGQSGLTEPTFPGQWTATVDDANGITWVNTGPVCETSGCQRGGLPESSCPTSLKVEGADGYVGCNSPANTCASGQAGDCDYYQCQNNAGVKDLFNNTLTLESANAGTYVCFSADDCPHGTTCQLDPQFAVGDDYQMTRGSGVCTPVAQNGGCGPSDNGQLCPGVNYPFMNYECHTLANAVSNAQVCVPPKTRGLGDLWWNAANWTHAAPTPTPAPTPTGSPVGTPTPTAIPTPSQTPVACTADGDCLSGQKCLTDPSHGGQEACPPGQSCTCWNPQPCVAASCPGPNQCLNQDGVADGQMDGQNVVDCTTETCYCSPQAIYSGACGPSNAKWLQAARQLRSPGARWPHSFKESCPVAYSYQFDDPSSNWSCENGGGLNGYRVIFCGPDAD